MAPTTAPPLADLTATAVRALVLYGLAEHQSGHAATLRVTAQGASFSMSDDGRGHPLGKTIEGTSYLQFIYTHFDYPFDAARSAPVQLQGIGMSLVNTLCSDLQLVVKKPDAELTLQFKDGKLVHNHRLARVSEDTGITVSATIAPHLCTRWVDASPLQAWLEGVLATAPALTLFFNGRQLHAAAVTAPPEAQ